jgi:glycosyltransferase involved in cell wall biosynthesis
MTDKRLRVAIVSDPLVQRGGAERVVETIASAFPDAPIFAILYSAKTGPASLASRVVPSFLQKIPGAVSRHRMFLPLYPLAIESFDLSGFDVIISSHHTAGKGVLRSAGQRHICYCHTPMRAVWERPHEELRTLPAIARPGAALMMHKFRAWDTNAALRVDEFVANSAVTQQRIAKHYGRFSTLLPPPIDTVRFTPGTSAPQDYYLVASRNVPYKRIDIAVAATALANRRLVITGSASRNFEAPHVAQLGHVGDAELLEIMRGAKALLFPGFEDFGMTPVEMMACGRPVIAYGAGGALETVRDGVTGLLVAEQTPEAFARAIAQFERTTFDVTAIRRHAEKYSSERFVSALLRIVYGEDRQSSMKIPDDKAQSALALQTLY